MRYIISCSEIDHEQSELDNQMQDTKLVGFDILKRIDYRSVEFCSTVNKAMTKSTKLEAVLAFLHIANAPSDSLNRTICSANW